MPTNKIVINDCYQYEVPESELEQVLEYIGKYSVGGQSLVGDETVKIENQDMNKPSLEPAIRIQPIIKEVVHNPNGSIDVFFSNEELMPINIIKEHLTP